MSINLNPSIGSIPTFKAQTRPLSPADTSVLFKAKQEQKVEKKKTGIVQGFKNILSSFGKAYNFVMEYSKAIVAGSIQGIIIGGATLGVFKLAKAFSKVPKGKDAVAFKKLGKFPKFIALTAALTTVGTKLFNASLKVSEKNAAVDHRYNTGHNS